MQRRPILALPLLLAAAAASADDHGDRRGSATQVAPTSTTEGHLDRNDRDYFRIDLPAAGALVLESASGLDTHGRLENDRGARIATDSNGGDGRNFRIARDLGPGTYYLVVRGRKGAVGAYVLTAAFTSSDDHGDSRNDATAVSTASSTAGELERRGDVDYFRIPVAEAGRLEVESRGHTDTSGRLEGSDGAVLAEDDDGGSGDNFRIARDVEAGTHYVAVLGFDDARTGAYRLEVSFVPAPPPVPPPGEGEEGFLRLAGGSQTQGRLEILHNGTFGMICDDGFDDLDADVACRQLGHASAAYWGNYETGHTSTSGRTWMSGLACTGSETRLDHCPHAGFGGHCTPLDGVHLACSGSDGLAVSIYSTNSSRVTEGRTAGFSLLRPGPASQQSAALTVRVQVSEDGDTLAVTPPDRVTFPPGSVSARLWLPTVNDEVDEAGSTITATLVDGEGYDVGDPASATVLVVDNDDDSSEVLTISIYPTNSTWVSEGQAAGFTMIRRGPAGLLSATTTALIMVSEDGDTLAATPPDSVAFPPGSSRVHLWFATDDDGRGEVNSTVTATLVDGEGYEVGESASASVLVTDNDGGTGVVDVVQIGRFLKEKIVEGDNAHFVLHRNAATNYSASLTVKVAVSEDGDTLSRSPPATATFPAGQALASLVLATDDDAVSEANSTITATLVAGEGYRIGRINSTSIRVVDNDAPVIAGFTLVNTSTGADVEMLADGDVVDLAGMSTDSFGIRADGVASGVGGVQLTLTSEWLTHSRIANASPYSLFGTRDSQIVGRQLPSGDYRISAAPASGARPLSLSFTIENGGPLPLHEGDLRLSDGSETEGRLEILHSGRWGTVCDDDFQDVDADVACRQLGHASGRIGSDGLTNGTGSGQIWLDNVDCAGDESRLDQCQHAGFGNHDCDHSEDVVVACVPRPSGPAPRLNPPANVRVDDTSRSHLRLRWNRPVDPSPGNLSFDVCIAAGTADCTPASRRYARPYHYQGNKYWALHLFGNPNGGTRGLTPGTTYRMCVLARRYERRDEFSPTVCVTGTTSGG